CDRLDDVRARTHGAADEDGDVVADALFAQARVDLGERQFDGDAHVVADAGGRRARASAEAVDGDDVRPAPRDAARDRRRVVHRRDLDDDRLLVFRRLFEGIDELLQVLDGIDVVMGRGGYIVDALP